MNFLYKKTIFLLYSLLLFFVPLISSNLFLDKYDSVKSYIIFLIGSLIILLFFINLIFNFKILQKFFKVNYLLISMLFFILINLLSSVFSYNTYTSFFSTLNSGGFLITFYLIILSLISFILFNKYQYLKLFYILFFSSFIVVLYSVFQYHFVTFDSGGIKRVGSTIGHPNWLAQYILFFIPLITVFFLNSKSYKIKVILAIIYALYVYTLSITFSLSGIIGFVFSLTFILKYYPLKKLNFYKYFYLFISTFFILFINLNFYIIKIKDLILDISKFSLVNNVALASNQNLLSDTTYIRYEIFKSLIQIPFLSIKNFLIGVGPQNTKYFFAQYLTNSFNYTSEWDFIVLNAHNYYLQLFVEIGIIGLILYLIFIILLYLKSPFIFKTVLIVFFVTNFFGWPSVSTSLLFWFLTSYILLVNEKK